MFRSLVLLLFAIAATARGDFDARAHARKFVLELSSERLASIADPNDQAGLPYSLRDVLEQYDCIEVREFAVRQVEARGDSTRVVIEIDATALTTGGVIVREPFPRNWTFIVRNEDGAITAAGLREAELADAVAAAPAAELRKTVDDHPDLDPNLFARWLSDLSATPEHAQKGIDATQFAVDLCQAIQDPSCAAFTMRMQSVVEVWAGRRQDALSSAKDGVALAKRAGDTDSLADSLFGLGIAHSYNGNQEAAVENLDASFALVGKTRDPRMSLKAAQVASNIDKATGHLTPVIHRAESARQWAQRTGWAPGETDALLTKGIVYGMLGNFDLAKSMYSMVYEQSRKLRDKRKMAYALHDLATAEMLDADRTAARKHLELAIRLMADNPEAMTYAMLASVNSADGRLSAAEAAAAEGLRVARRKDERVAVVSLLNELAIVQLLRGNHQKAAALAREAIETIEVIGEGAHGAGTVTSYSPCYVTLARALRKLGQTQTAIAALQSAMALNDAERMWVPESPLARVHYADSIIAPERDLIEIYAQKAHYADAAHVSAKLKARALRESVLRGKVDFSSALSPEEAARENELTKNIIRLNRAVVSGKESSRAELEEARLELDRYQTDLYLKHPQLELRRVSGDDFDVADVAGKGLILDYTITESSIVALAIDGKAITGTVIPIREELLQRRIGRYAGRMRTGDLRHAADGAYFHDLLLKPFASRIAKHHLISIVPDGALWNVPFHALLIDRHAVYYEPSLSAMALTIRRAKEAPRECLIMANPRLPDGGSSAELARERGFALRDLPDALREGQSLLQVYPGARLLAGANADEGTLKNEIQSFRIVHFATHGLLDSDAPMYSALVLASSSDREDGLLEAREVIDLELDADLVVLSACDTARGKVAAGEGVLGLSWAFMVAGSPRTVATTWKVDSKAASDLMIDFHRHIRAGLAPAEALRRAQLALRRNPKYRHPYYWAPFVLIGEGATALYGR